MITYNALEDGSLSGNGISLIPVGHRFYTQALAKVEAGEAEILSYSEPELKLGDYVKQLVDIYDKAMRNLQNGYSDEEVKTFTPKQDAIREYEAGGLAGLSASNRRMIEALTGSTTDSVLEAKLERMVKASHTFKTYLGLIEHLRDQHIDQLVDGQDNSAIIESLAQAYARA